MSEQHASVDESPLIPMPALTPAGLRTAVAQIAPAYLPTFVEHLDQAVEQAAAQSTIAPLQNFLNWWGEFVAVQRFPARAARLRQLEQTAAEAVDRDFARTALAAIRQMMGVVRREAAE